MKQTDLDWFQPLWRRIAITAFVAAWVALEWLVWQDELFRWITLAALAYAIWTFFIKFDERGGKGDGNGGSQD